MYPYYAPYQIHDERPAAARIDFNDLSNVEKYELPKEAYEKRHDSVLAWKKNQKLGRFNPDATPPDQLLREAAKKDEDVVKENGVVTHLYVYGACSYVKNRLSN